MPNPEFIPVAFAENGVKNPIQKQLQPGQDPEDATWDSGWNPITMIPIEDGGLAPKGQDFNGLFNVLSQHAIHRQNGEQIKFSQDVVDEFGGYAIGSIVQSDDGLREYRSLINNNTFNPNTTPIVNRWEVYTGVGSLPIASSSTAGITKVLNVLNSSDSGSALSAAQGKVLNDNKLDKNAVINNLTSTSTTSALSAAQGKVLNDNKLDKSAVINNLTSTSATSALSAAQGKVLNDKMLGVGQTWQDVTSSRTSGTVYTNSIGRPITVNILSGSQTNRITECYVGSVLVARSRTWNEFAQDITTSFIVPNGQNYRVVSTNIDTWVELR